MSALRPSATFAQESTRWTIDCSAPWVDITSTVPPMIPIQMLNGAENVKSELKNANFPAAPASVSAALQPPSINVGI